MKKFTDLVKENNTNQTFKFTAKVNISGHVMAENEGSAGELVDQEIDAIVEHLNLYTTNDLADGTYEIVSIDPTDSIDIDNNYVMEALDSHRISQLFDMSQEIVELIMNKIEDFSPEEKFYFLNLIKNKIK